MSREQLPENKEGRPPPEGAPHDESPTDKYSTKLDLPDGIAQRIRHIPIPEGFPRVTRKGRVEPEYVHVEKFQDEELFEQSPEQWLKNRHPEWTDEQIRSMLVRIEVARLIELFEDIKKELTDDMP